MSQAPTHVTFLRLSGTNMYSVRPLAFTSTVPSFGSFRVEILTTVAPADVFAEPVAKAVAVTIVTTTAAVRPKKSSLRI